jgi:hypothetical protein
LDKLVVLKRFFLEGGETACILASYLRLYPSGTTSDRTTSPIWLGYWKTPLLRSRLCNESPPRDQETPPTAQAISGTRQTSTKKNRLNARPGEIEIEEWKNQKTKEEGCLGMGKKLKRTKGLKKTRLIDQPKTTNSLTCTQTGRKTGKKGGNNYRIMYINQCHVTRLGQNWGAKIL